MVRARMRAVRFATMDILLREALYEFLIGCGRWRGVWWGCMARDEADDGDGDAKRIEWGLAMLDRERGWWADVCTIMAAWKAWYTCI
jgi:hypothetical protein